LREPVAAFGVGELAHQEAVAGWCCGHDNPVREFARAYRPPPRFPEHAVIGRAYRRGPGRLALSAHVMEPSPEAKDIAIAALCRGSAATSCSARSSSSNATPRLRGPHGDDFLEAANLLAFQLRMRD
jgi:hypothetical protein